jgi:hypothetical protein
MSNPPVTLADFEAARVSAEDFTHEAHVYMAWLYLRDVTLPEALQKYASSLRRLTKKLGAEQKYHETITWFFVITVAERMAAGDCSNWPDFKNANPDLMTNAATLLERRYSADRLQSPVARRQFVLPDIGGDEEREAVPAAT